MGVVYEAFQQDLQRRVALKVIAPGVVSSADARGGFEREARLAASVRHPGIVTVHEVGTADGHAYLAMEFVEGESLGARLEGGQRVEPRAGAGIVLEVARAVAALHELGIVHRDLKPDNVLIDRDGRARVTDFGLALLRSDEHAVSGGTPGFMAPEQLSARFGPVGERSDVYGLGALLHALLTGRRPHDGSSVLEVVMATIETDLPPSVFGSGVPAALSAICRRCLEREPARRYASAAALADDLERWLRGDATEAVPPGWLRRMQLFFLRRRMLSAHLVTLIAFELLTLVDHLIIGVTAKSYFVSINLVLGMLMVASLLLDWCDRRGLLRRSTRYIWPVLDGAGLTFLLHEGDGLRSSLVILYPLLILTTGFWLDRAVVLATTAVTIACYGLLIVFPNPTLPVGIDQHLAVCTTILVTGLILSQQVARARALRDHASRRF